MSTCTYNEYNPDVCFQQNVLPIFVSKCGMSECHDGSTNKRPKLNLLNYEGIMAGVTPNHPDFSSVYTSVAGINPSMPPKSSPQLTNEEKSYIKIWIRMGAKNTSNCSSCDTSGFSYSAVIKAIITNWCVGCHSATNAGGGYDLSTYSGVSAAIVKNRFMGTIQQLSGYSPMPQGGKLSDCDIKLIVKWFNSGYPNN